MTKLTNKVIWITGASSGIGEALVYALAKKNVKLIISSRRKEELEKVKGNCIAQAQPNVRVLPFDLSEPSTLKLSAEAAIQLFGHVDIASYCWCVMAWVWSDVVWCLVWYFHAPVL